MVESYKNLSVTSQKLSAENRTWTKNLQEFRTVDGRVQVYSSRAKHE